MEIDGLVSLESPYSVEETASRLENLLRAKGIKIFARIDQAAEAKTAGLTMPPTVLLIFGDPATGTPLMVKYPSLAMDLPLRALIAESAGGETVLSYLAPEYYSRRYGITPAPFAALPTLFKKVIGPGD